MGAAIHAAVAAGAYPDVYAGEAAMGKALTRIYTSDAAAADAYAALYAEYRELDDYFGRGGNDALHRLSAISTAARTRRGSLSTRRPPR